MICGKKIVIKFNQNISLSSWLDWTWELYRMYICTTRLVSKTKNIYKNLQWTFWKINPVYLSKRKKWWSRPIEFSKWIEFFVLLRHKTINHQNIIISFHQIPIYFYFSQWISQEKYMFLLPIFFHEERFAPQNSFLCFFLSKK